MAMYYLLKNKLKESIFQKLKEKKMLLGKKTKQNKTTKKRKKPVSKRQIPYDATHEVSRLLKSTKTSGCGGLEVGKGEVSELFNG